jgi:hypothetical protein
MSRHRKFTTYIQWVLIAAVVICSVKSADAQTDNKEDRCITNVKNLHVGMSEADVAPMTHCLFASINTTETASGTRKQVVFYRHYPTWVLAYISIEGGRIVAIQRSE